MVEKLVGLADVLAIENVNAAASADQRIPPTGDVAVTRFLGPRDDARLRPGLTFVVAAGESQVLVRLRLGGTLRPDRHERAVRSVKDKEMLVAGVVDGGVGHFRHENHEIGFGDMEL